MKTYILQTFIQELFCSSGTGCCALRSKDLTRKKVNRYTTWHSDTN